MATGSKLQGRSGFHDIRAGHCPAILRRTMLRWSPLRRQLSIPLQRQVFSMVPVQLQVGGLKQKSDRVARRIELDSMAA
jgi:hypothetical protein